MNSRPLRCLGRCLHAAALLAAAATAAAAELAVSPTRLQFEAGAQRAMLQLHNAGRDAVTVQAELLSWSREGGVDRHAASDAILVSPPIFRIEPGATQIVRLALRHRAAEDHEAAYRLQLRELPSAEVPEGLRVLLALRLPVHVAPRQVQRAARWRALDGPGRAVWLHNAGNVHLRVQALRLPRDGAAAGDELPLGWVLFPGEGRALPLPAGTPLPGEAALELQTDRGPLRATPAPVGP